MSRRSASTSSEKKLPPLEERPGLKCQVHKIMLVDGYGEGGKPEPSRYCALCTRLRCVDGVRALYVPKSTPPPAPAGDSWIPEDL